jgi:ABC-2 type transport system permease protein
MNLNMIAALVLKDITLMYKNRFFAFISIVGLLVYIAIYFALPRTVDETLEMGISGPGLPDQMSRQLQEQGLILRSYESEAALRAAVEAGDEPVGIATPPDFLLTLAGGGQPQVTVYFQSTLPSEFRQMYSMLLEELMHTLVGQELNLEVEEILLGPDMAGQQVPPRDRILPMLAVFILTMEIWGLANLISTELETGTLRAILVTHLKLEGLFTSKGITGMSLAFTQVLILLAITGGLRTEPLLVIAILLLGSLLITGISFLIASVSRDFMTVMGWGMLALILLAIPSFNLMLPGLTTNWIRILPSYYFVDSLAQVMSFGAGWSQVSGSLLILLAWGAGFFGFGVFVLERKMR